MIDHKEADRVPKFDAFWSETVEAFHEQGLPKDLTAVSVKIASQVEPKIIASPIEDYFNFDVDSMHLDNSMRHEARVVEKTEEYTIIQDRCGYTAKFLAGRSGAPHFLRFVNTDKEEWKRVKHGFALNVNDQSRIDTEPFFLRVKPVPSWEDESVLYNEIRKRGKFLVFRGYGPWEATWRHHGFTESLMDLIAEKEYTREMFEKTQNVTIETLEYAMEKGMKPDGYWITEDLGTTRAPLMSSELYKEMVWPFHKQLGQFLHKNGIKFMMHSCGKVDGLIRHFIEAGLDVIQPLQANTGMNVADLKKEYGKDITFWGNISVEKLAGSFKDIEKEIGDKLTDAKKDGGYIYHSDHSIPPNVSLEKYTYAMKMVDEFGRY